MISETYNIDCSVTEIIAEMAAEAECVEWEE